MEQQKPRQDDFTKRFDTIFAFLILEIIALASFGIGGALGIRLLQIIGFFLSLFSIPFIQNNYTKQDLKPNLPWLIPLGLFCLLMGFSAFFFRAYGGFGLNSMVYMLLETLGLAGFFLLGVAANFIPVLKKEYLLYALLGGLALYCVIVGIYSLIRYGFFYAALYKGMFYYYQGVLYPVSTEGKALLGFEFGEVSLKYGCLASLLLGSSGAGLFALSPKKEGRKFLILAALAGVGILYNLLIPYLPALAFMAFVYVFAGLYCLLRHLLRNDEKKRGVVQKVFVFIYFILIGVVALGTLALLLDGKLHILSNLLKAVFGRVPGRLQVFFDAANDAVYNGAVNADLGRIDLMSLLFGYRTPTAGSLHLTSIFELNVLWQNGFLAFGLLCFVIFFAFKQGRDYLREGKEDLHFRLAIAMMALAIFLYASLFADDQPIVHGQQLSFFTQSNYMMVSFFLLGLMTMPKKAKEVEVHE